MNFGLKYALLNSETGVLSFQWRTYVPTGDTDRGLGTNHVSLEPSLLWYGLLSDRTGVEAESRYWVPIGRTDFVGDIFRYGVGMHYDMLETDSMRLSPVVELVGRTLLDGRESFAQPGGSVEVNNASGDTIVNLKIGSRLELANGIDMYAGWGRPLSGDNWYENILRLELRRNL